MGSLRNITKELTNGDSNGQDYRRFGRLRCLDVRCDLGQVVNISAAGLRVRCRHKPMVNPNRPFAMEISSTFGRFRAGAQLAWIKKIGWFKYEIGLQLVEIGPGGREILAEIARTAPSEAFTLKHSLTEDDAGRRAG